MRTFEHFNSKVPCPICGTTDDKETILIGIVGTQEGFNIQAVQVHTACLEQNILYSKEMGFIYCIANK